jgi:hypothetical protein
MKRLTGMTAGLLLSLAAGAAFAQTPPPPAEAKGDHQHKMRDCGKIEDADKKGRCEAHQKAMKAAWEKCKEKAEGPDRRGCMRENMPKREEKK